MYSMYCQVHSPEEHEMRKTLKASLVADPIVDPKTKILNFSFNPKAKTSRISVPLN